MIKSSKKLYPGQRGMVNEHFHGNCLIHDTRFTRTNTFCGVCGCIAKSMQPLGTWRCRAPIVSTLLFVSVGCVATDELPPDFQRLVIVFWDIESSGSEVTTIVRQLNDLLMSATPEIICLSQVNVGDFDTLRNAARFPTFDAAFRCINGSTGSDSSRLQVLYDASRISLLESNERVMLGDASSDESEVPSPIAAHFLDVSTGRRFWLLSCRFSSTDTKLRTRMAAEIRKWAAKHAEDGVVIVGDFSLDYHYHSGVGNETFDELSRDKILAWVKPLRFDETHWSDKNMDGKNDQDSLVGAGAFLLGSPTTWKPKVEIMGFPADFPDSKQTSNSRPFMIRFIVPKETSE